MAAPCVFRGSFQVSGGCSYIWGNSKKSYNPSSFLKVLKENGPKQICFLHQWVIIDFKFNLVFLGPAHSPEMCKVSGVSTCWAELGVLMGRSSRCVWCQEANCAPWTPWCHQHRHCFNINKIWKIGPCVFSMAEESYNCPSFAVICPHFLFCPSIFPKVWCVK